MEGMSTTESHVLFNASGGFEYDWVVVSSPRWLEIASGIWLFFLLVLGSFLNATVLVVFTRYQKPLSSNDVLVVGLTFNHLCMAGIATYPPMIAEFSGGWFVAMDIHICSMEAFTVFWLGMGSLYILVTITLTRYVAVTRPYVGLRFSRKMALLTVLLCEMLALVEALAPLVGVTSYGLEAHGTACGLDWKDRKLSGIVYKILLAVIGYGVPVILMIFSYCMIFKTASSSASVIGTLEVIKRKERRLIKMGVLMVGMFMLSWTPYAIVSFYVTFGNPRHVHPVVSRLPSLLAKSEVLWNPFIYAFTTPYFRKRVMEGLPVKCEYNRSRTTPEITTTVPFTIQQEHSIPMSNVSIIDISHFRAKQNKPVPKYASDGSALTVSEHVDSPSQARIQLSTTNESPSTGRTRNYFTDRTRDQSTDITRDQSTERTRDQSTDITRDQSTERTRDQSTDITRDQSTERTRDQSTCTTIDQSTCTTIDQSTSMTRENKSLVKIVKPCQQTEIEC